MLVYRTMRKGGTPGDWLIPERALEEMKARVGGKGPWGIKLRGEATYQPVRGMRRLMHRIRKLQGQMRSGDALWVRCSKGSIYTMTCGFLHLEHAPPIPSPHTEAIAQAWTFLFEEAQRLAVELNRKLHVVTMGIYNCRHIDGSTTWSQHAWANGLDFIIKRLDNVTDIEAMDLMCNELANRGFVAQVLWRGVPNHYPGHAHISGEPMRTGTPPCA